MGLFKKIKKAISGVVKAPLKAVGLAADAPNVQTAAETPVAAPQEAPKEVVEDVESSADTESGKKKTRASGKKSLSVSRSSGGGINL